MSTEDYREPPPGPATCPECGKSDRVEPLADPHPKAFWWCARDRMAFSGTAAEAFRHKQAKAERYAEDHEATEALRRAREDNR